MSEVLVVEAVQAADSAVIWLHGLGADRYDFEPVAKMLQKQLPTTRFVLPQAPTQAVTINAGYAMPSWYDILSLSEDTRAINQEQMERSAQTVLDLIEQQRDSGINPANIVLAGFSQGGAVVLHSAFLRWQGPLGGVMALSTYGPTFTDKVTIADSQKSIPVLFAHGTQDPVVAPQLGRRAFDFLGHQGISVTWNQYPMEHEVVLEEINDIANWLSARFN